MKNPTSIAHTVNSQFYIYRRQHEEALSELERAILLDPNDPSSNVLMGAALLFMGKPREAVDFLHRAMRLDPHNPSFYLARLGAAQFCLGNLEEAANLLERALRLNPELSSMITGFLASTYGLLGRQQEARTALDSHRKGYMTPYPKSLFIIMSNYPFKDRVIANRFAEGIIKAGMPGQPSGYFPAFQENRLNGKEIKHLLFGSTITGIDASGIQWWIDRQKNGDIALRGQGPFAADIGKSRVEGDVLCTQFQKRMWGVEYCATVFRNPNGTRERRNEYFFVTDIGPAPFSLLR